MASPSILKAATPEEQIGFRWLEKVAGLSYQDSFLFFPLLLGGINLGYIPVNFYIRAGVVGSPVGWRIRPRPFGNERVVELSLVEVQQQLSTTILVRVDAENVRERRNQTLRSALLGKEVNGT